jgi:hypothetical protein
MTVVPSPHHFFPLFPQLKIQLEDRHFDTTDVIEAKSQVVLNTLTKYDIQGEF